MIKLNYVLNPVIVSKIICMLGMMALQLIIFHQVNEYKNTILYKLKKKKKKIKYIYIYNNNFFLISILIFNIIEFLNDLFTRNGFEVIENNYILKETTNRKQQITFERRFVQAKFRKICQIQRFIYIYIFRNYFR